jgi:hypothetical protein
MEFNCHSIADFLARARNIVGYHANVKVEGTGYTLRGLVRRSGAVWYVGESKVFDDGMWEE